MKVLTYQESCTAGFSPNKNNMRLELFLLGCKRYNTSFRCKGCFNKEANVERQDIIDISPELRAKDYIENMYPNPSYRYLTISGGEPFDQLKDLIEYCKILKNHDNKIDIICYTWHDLNNLLNEPKNLSVNTEDVKELIKYVDMIIDGSFIQERCIYDYSNDNNDHNKSAFIGSDNQGIWIFKNSITRYDFKDYISNFKEKKTKCL